MPAIEPVMLGVPSAGGEPIDLLPKMANRHGLIAGATGTGKTVSLRVIAEQMSKLGVPCFIADVKGDIAGMAKAGETNPRIEDRVKKLKIEGFQYQATPVVFWDVYGERGHPFRSTMSEMGPLLLARMLNLNDIQEAVLYIAFRVADDNGLLLLDLKDMQSMLAWMGENVGQIEQHYGKVSAASLAAIQRGLLVLEQEGAGKFFGEPGINLEDLMQTDGNGRGIVNILAAEKLYLKPKMYSTVLLWLLSELFEQLPEVGDMDKPKMLFFFDEAHLLFNDAPKALLEKIEQVTRLIRSKGVGVYYVTQNPLDVPDIVLGQLGNRVQHALRAFTVRDQKAVKAAAETFRINPKLDVEKAITELGTGEALVSTLDEKGTPTMVERALIRPPESRLGVITEAERKEAIAATGLSAHYDRIVDRESAYEMIKGGLAKGTPEGGPAGQPAEQRPQIFKKPAETGGIMGTLGGLFGSGSSSGRGNRQSVGEAMMKSVARAAGSEVGRRIVRGVLGSIFRR